MEFAEILKKFRLIASDPHRQMIRIEESKTSSRPGPELRLRGFLTTAGSVKFSRWEATYWIVAQFTKTASPYQAIASEGGTVILSPKWTALLDVKTVDSAQSLWCAFLFHFNTPKVEGGIRVIEDAVLASIWAIEKCQHNEGVVSQPKARTSKGGMRDRAILALLAKIKPGRGIQGKSILRKLPADLGDIEESTLRKHHLASMVQRGEIKNTPGIGYHLP